MITILVTVTLGLVVVQTSLPQLARNEVNDPDYLRSHWTDVRAFAIANTFDNSFSHLLLAPLVAGAVETAGSIAGRARWMRLAVIPADWT
jgi:hypothetical protein